MVPQIGQRSRARETSALGPRTHLLFKGGVITLPKSGRHSGPCPPRGPLLALHLVPSPSGLPQTSSLCSHYSLPSSHTGPWSGSLVRRHEVPRPSLPPGTPSPIPPAQIHPSALVTGRAPRLGCSHKGAPLPGSCAWKVQPAGKNLLHPTGSQKSRRGQRLPHKITERGQDRNSRAPSHVQRTFRAQLAHLP